MSDTISYSSCKFVVDRQIKYNKTSQNEKKGTITWYCEMYGCNARIITKEGKIIARKGMHRNISHKAWTNDQIKKHDLDEKISQRMRAKSESAHKAYNTVTRDHPVAATVSSGWRDHRNKAYYANSKAGFKLPQNSLEIPSTLKKLGLDANYYGQKLTLKDYDDASVTPELLAEWKSRVSPMCLGNDGRPEFLVFCSLSGAKLLRITDRLHFDVSFKCTPKISPRSNETIPYKGALHLLAVFAAKDSQSTPMTVPCATILFKADKPTAAVYDLGIKYLRKRCIEEFGIDIIDSSRVIQGMGDYETPLRNAIVRSWKIMLNGCLFHYSQCLNRNLQNKGLMTLYQKNGRNFNFGSYKFIRMFHALALLPPNLVPKGWNILSKNYPNHVPAAFHGPFINWLKYHQKQWMSNAKFIVEWNCYRSIIRTNNSLEVRNSLVNQDFGAHPYLFEFAKSLAKWHEDGFIAHQQYVIHEKSNPKHQSEVLKEKILLKWWDYIDDKQSEETIWSFLQQTSIALKADKKTLMKML